MSDTVIEVSNLGKQYRIGGPAVRYHTLRDTLTRWATAPARWLRGGGANDRRTIWALRDVSFEVKRGEVVGVIGRNGAGKSTLLKILSRITEPTEGEATVWGRVGSLLEVGTGFNPELTGRENVFLNGAILGMRRKEIERKFDEIVAFAEVEKFIDTPVKHYSSGMHMRLAFAVAAHLEPEILIVDEVLAVGDAEFQRKCLGKMGEVAGGGRTILFVSHNMAAVNRLCARGIVLDRGRVVFDGPATEATGRYLRDTTNEGGGRTWSADEAPGTDELKLLAVRLVRSDGTSATTVEVSEPLRLELHYRTTRPGMRFRCAAVFQTEGAVAFSTLEQVEQERTSPGDYVSAVEIPPHLFAELEYSVAVSIMHSVGGTKHHYVKLPDALTFQVYDPMEGTSARGDYSQYMAGVLRPRLTWHWEAAGGNGLDEAKGPASRDNRSAVPNRG